jgi:hypothetical protein
MSTSNNEEAKSASPAPAAATALATGESTTSIPATIEVAKHPLQYRW